MEFTGKNISISKNPSGYQIKFEEHEDDDNHEYNENDNYLLMQ